jgi:hypothetical protein
MLRYLAYLAFVVFFFGSIKSEAQFMKKLQQKASKELLKGIDDGKDEKSEDVVTQNPNSSTSNTKNNRGGGLKMTPPNVIANISEARSSLKTKSYGQVRFAIREAMRGVELEIGGQILKSLPTSVSGLNFNEDQDQVVTSGVGFVGLVIARNYSGGDQELESMISNNSVMISSVNLYLMNSAYTQSGESDGTQYKRVTVQGNKALIQYSDDTGYQLSVPLGQSTLFNMNCINFESEDQVISASDQFDLAEIKTLLGEN